MLSTVFVTASGETNTGSGILCFFKVGGEEGGDGGGRVVASLRVSDEEVKSISIAIWTAAKWKKILRVL